MAGGIQKAGIRLTVEGKSQYLADLRAVNNEMKLMAINSKLALAQLGNHASTTDKYKVTMQGLGTQLTQQSSKYKALSGLEKDLTDRQSKLTKEVENSKKQFELSNKRTQDLKVTYEQLRGSLGKSAKDTQLANKAYKDSLKSTKKLEQNYNKLSESLNKTTKELGQIPIDMAKSELATARLNNQMAKTHEIYRNSGGRLADTAKHFKKVGDVTGNISQKLGNLSSKTRGLTIGIAGGLTGATKAYLDFENQTKTIKALLKDSYTDTKQLDNVTNQLASSSQQMGMKYGESSSKIREGMKELIKKGFSANATLGATPAILKASIASGDDFNSVMETSASVLTQFGLVTNDTNKMLANTEMATSTLTFVANKTSAGFSDLGEAMQNVGPIAHSNNQSLQDMASALGIMSNAGIKGGEAGTYLANVLRNLATPTKTQKQALQELGVSAFDSSGKMRPLPAILDDIATATEGLTDEEKGKVLSRIFNQRAIKGALPLLQQGKGAIAELSKETGKAIEYQNKLAEEMGNTGERQLMKFKENVMALGVAFGKEALPHLVALTDKLKDLMQGFSSLDDGTKKAIITMLLGAAAISPLAKAFSGLFGAISVVNNGWGKLIQNIGKLTTAKQAKDMADLGKSALDAGGAISKIGGAGATAGAGASAFFNPWSLALLGIVALAGTVAYELAKPNIAHMKSVQRTKGAYGEWFKAISDGERVFAQLEKASGKATEQVEKDLKQRIKKIKEHNLEVSELMDANAGSTNKLKNFFQGTGSQIEIGGQKRVTVNENLSNSLKQLEIPEDEAKRLINKYKEIGTNIGNSMSQIGEKFKTHSVITSEWSIQQIKTVNDTAQGTISGFEKMRQERIKDLNSQVDLRMKTRAEADKEIQDINKRYDEHINTVKKAQQSISTILSTASRENRKLTEKETVSLLKSYQKLADESGKSMSNMADVQKLLGENLSSLTGQMGLDFLKTAGIIDEATTSAVLNAKTGAEKVQILQKALQGWNEFELTDKQIEIHATGEEKVKKLIDGIQSFNNLKPEEKELIAKCNNPEELEQTLQKLNLWNDLKVGEKALILNSEIADANVQKAIQDANLWNAQGFIPKFMEIDTNAPDAKQKIIDLVNEYLHMQEKPALTVTAETYGVSESTEALKEFNGVSDRSISKHLIVSAEAGTLPSVTENIKQYNFNSGKMENKSVLATTSTNASNNTPKIKDYNTATNNMKNKSSTATTSTNASQNTSKVKAWVDAVFSAPTNKTSVFSVVVKGAVGLAHKLGFMAQGGHIQAFATGGKIPMFANGGNIDMFASGGSPQNPKRGYTGIVGEAGPELFQVTRNGVNITPLSTREKMRGIGGVLEDHSNKGDVSFNISINNPIVREDKDIERIYDGVVKKIKSDAKFDLLFSKGV
ncbi:MAG: phage tail tape measure protein [Finegoldia magna]|uniref:phage tail tape measure protein n=1 Tax=Finegoldia magna TaxID=1260 RepID=UPI00290D72F0|nr:phage tail tape measure protein [Finegoldia magna]MDU5527315.1 phage tail tape measure protein [Finegoldia magna]